LKHRDASASTRPGILLVLRLGYGTGVLRLGRHGGAVRVRVSQCTDTIQSAVARTCQCRKQTGQPLRLAVPPCCDDPDFPKEPGPRQGLFKVQAQFKSTTSKVHPGRSGVASIPAQFKSTTSKVHPGRSGVASIPAQFKFTTSKIHPGTVGLESQSQLPPSQNQVQVATARVVRPLRVGCQRGSLSCRNCPGPCQCTASGTGTAATGTASATGSCLARAVGVLNDDSDHSTTSLVASTDGGSAD
jgi:hypothetical protein